MSDQDVLADQADAALAACAAAWPDVRIPHERVVVRLRPLELGATARAHLGELCLVWACLEGDAAAQRIVDRMIRSEAERAVRELRQAPWLADDVHGDLASRLLVATGDGDARLATYAGQAPLGRWLGVAATRTALNLMRGKRLAVPIDGEVGDELAAAIADPDLAVIRERYGDALADAVRKSFEALGAPRDRNLLRLYYLERVGLDELGRMFGVHASTVSRWLGALREQLVDETRFRLGERLGMDGQYSDLESVIRALRSDLDITLSRILRT